MGIELRGRFIIDPDGVIQAMEVLTPPVGPQVRRDDAPDPGLPARARQQGHRGDARGVETRADRCSSRGRTSSGNVWKVWQPKMEK